MIVAPTTSEWIWVYVPLAILLVVGMVVELRTTRIPNSLSLTILMYLCAARLVIGPAPIQSYLLSVGVTASVFIGIGFVIGIVSGGAAKFAVAVSAALLPWMSLLICGVCIAAVVILRVIDKYLVPVPPFTLPGSVVISMLAVGIVLLTVLKTSFQPF